MHACSSPSSSEDESPRSRGTLMLNAGSRGTASSVSLSLSPANRDYRMMAELMD